MSFFFFFFETVYFLTHLWVVSNLIIKDQIINGESFNNLAENPHPVLTDKSFYLWPATRTAQTLEPEQDIHRSQPSYTVRLEVYKNPGTQAGGLVFRERGRLSIGPIMWGAKLCCFLLLGSYTLARKYAAFLAKRITFKDGTSCVLKQIYDRKRRLSAKLTNSFFFIKENYSNCPWFILNIVFCL